MAHSRLQTGVQAVQYPTLSSTFPMIGHPIMNNEDPTNEFMYQMPHGMEQQLKQQEGPAIDPQALTDRLQSLGLHQPSYSTDIGLNGHQQNHQGSSSGRSSTSTPPTSYSPVQNAAHPYNFSLARSRSIAPTTPGSRNYPPTHELRPDDSVSVMYRPYRAPSSIRSTPVVPAPGLRDGRGRKGGTDIDPGEGVSPRSRYHSQGYGEKPVSAFAGDEMTQRSPSPSGWMEPTTGQSQYTAGTHGGMYAMRDRLLREQAEREAFQIAELNRSLDDTARLASAMAKLESTEEQLRTLQATLIAEKVVRTQIERDREEHENDMRECRDELASAIRALRRAREEGKRGDEEKKSLARSYETVRAKLYKYEQELAVRDALARGREKGRQEAWDEAGKWMGVSPPIPIEPVRTIPETVFHQAPQYQQYQQQPQYGYAQPAQQDALPLQQYPAPSQQAQQQGGLTPGANQAYYNPTEDSQQPPQPFQPPPGTAPSNYNNIPPSSQHTGGNQGILSQAANIVYQQQTGQSIPQQGTHPLSQFSAQPTQNQHTQHGQLPVQMPSAQPPHDGYPPTGPTVIGMPIPQPIGYQQPVFAAPTTLQGSVPPPRAASAQAPYGRQVSHSAPYHTTNLPPQPQQPMRAATVFQRSPSRHDQQQSISQRPPPTSIPSIRHQSQTGQRPHPADSYLERVEQDPKLQQMLQGAPSKTIHSSNFPPTEYTHGTHGGGVGEFATDKPLPIPQPESNIYPGPIPSAGVARAQSSRRPSFGGTAGTGQSGQGGNKSRRRLSLSEGVHPSSHMMSQIPDGDRYPAFPGAHGLSTPNLGVGGGGGGRGRGHSRDTSLGSIDPAHYALPPSTMHSANQTPQTQGRHPLSASHSARQTPQSQSAKTRSRLAGALRNNTEMEMEELSQIDEENEARHSRENERDLMQSMVMQNMKNEEKQRGRSRSGSMPPMRWQPRLPVMPTLLGGGKAHTELRHGPSHGRRPSQSQSQYTHNDSQFHAQGPGPDIPPRSHPLYVPPEMAPRAVSGGVEDIQGPRHSALGLEGLESRPGSTARNALGNARSGTGNGQQQASNHDSQGQSQSQVQGQGHGYGQSQGGLGVGGGFSIKAPTITIQPPSTRSRSNQQSQVPSPSFRHEGLPQQQQQPQSRTNQAQTQLRSHTHTVEESNRPSKRQTTIITEYYDHSPHQNTQTATQPKPQDIPLPRSRAPTMTTVRTAKQTQPSTATQRQMQPHEIPLPKSRAPTVINPLSVGAANIPLPASRSQAPTAYDPQSPREALSPTTTHRSRGHSTAKIPTGTAMGGGGSVPMPRQSAHTLRTMPSVSIIDYAARQPLPDSRPTTMMGTPKAPARTSPSEVDRGAAGAHSNAAGSTRRTTGAGTAAGGVDPSKVPLPHSRAPTTRPRASTYARTEGTIEEVTEEESGREDRHGKKRW